MWVIPILFLIIMEGISDIISESWALKGGNSLWILAIGGYVVANLFWLLALRDGAGLTRGNLIFSVGTVIVGSALGIFLFHENVTPIQLLGILLGILAITLIIVG